MKRIQSYRMFISEVIEEIKIKGVAYIGWQLQTKGEQENCFHKFTSAKEVDLFVKDLKGLEYVEVFRPR